MRLRHLFRDLAIYGFGDMLLRATAFITLPIYTRIFTPAEYGVWSYVVTVIGVISALLALGGDTAYARFYFEAKTLEQKRVITSTWLGFLALWSAVVVLLLLPVAGIFSQWSLGNSTYGVLFILALIGIPIQLTNQLCGQALRNEFRPSLFAGLNVTTTILSISISLLAVTVFNLGIMGIVVGLVLAATIMLPVRLYTVRHLLRPVFSASTLRQMLSFGVPLVPTSLAYWIFVTSDRLVLGKLSTLEQVGLYSVANSLTSILSLASGALGQAWAPHAVRMYEHQRDHAPIFFGRVLTYILIGFGLLCVGITTFAHEALVILSTPAFYPAALAVGPLALGFVAYASTQVTGLSISLTKKTHHFSIHSWVAALLNLSLNLLLVPRWGMIAASWTTALSYAYITVAYSYVSQRLWPITYEKRSIAIISILTIIFTVTAPSLPQLGFLSDLLLKTAYCFVYIGAMIVLRVFDYREWRMLLAFLQSLQFSRVRKAV